MNQHLSAAGFALLQRNEDCRLVAYRDSGGVWTIGWGTTRYPDGRRVQQGDVCTQEQADAWLRWAVRNTEKQVDDLTVDSISQREFDSLVSFTYNVGGENYRTSTLRRMVNAADGQPGIRDQFMRWHFDDHVPVEGLWKRRWREADFYFGTSTACPPFPH